jgi:FAD/FMN-containing dehydrogenase
MYWRADFINELPDAAIARHIEYARTLPTPLSLMHLYPTDGAPQRVDRHATAFSYREANWNQVIVGVSPNAADRERITKWTKDYWEAIHPYSAGAAYVNFLMHDEGRDRVRASYRDNYPRLVEVKRRYDPENHFRVNQNIAPVAVGAGAGPSATV